MRRPADGGAGSNLESHSLTRARLPLVEWPVVRVQQAQVMKNIECPVPAAKVVQPSAATDSVQSETGTRLAPVKARNWPTV